MIRQNPYFLLLLIFTCVAFTSCSVKIENIKMCSTAGVMSAGADCVMTLSDEASSLSLDEWIEFLEPQPEHPDPADHSKIIPARGAALCMSPEDFQKLKTATEQLCKKVGRWCTFEAQDTMESVDGRVQRLQSKVMTRRKKHDSLAGKNPIQRPNPSAP